MILRRLLPQGMMARLTLVLAAALCLEFAVNAVVSKWEERGLLSEERTRRIAEQLAGADQILMQIDPARRPGIAAEMAVQGMTLNWVSKTVITDSSRGHFQLGAMRTRLEAAAPRLAGRDLRLNLIPSDDGGTKDLLGALRLGDGSFVTFRVRPFLASPPPFALTTVLHLLLVTAVLGVALLMMRAFLRPLSDLAAAAAATERGKIPVLGIEGPREVRRVAVAFREMQARLLQMVEDHSQALVAVSHDLRTPIQRLRLRVALQSDEPAREAMTADLADMEKFIASVADFLKSGEDEAARLVDLAAIAMTMVDNASDTGANIDYEGPASLPIRLKPGTLKRALGNLIDNACTHGSRARVLLQAGDPIVLVVEDDGPGIPPAQREEVFLPFRRLHSIRDGGGSGLGLAIVRKAVASIEGQVVLEDSPMGGLAARITLRAR